MGKWRKSSPELVAAFDQAFPDQPGVARRKMFGFQAGFVNGNMFGGLFQDTCIVRLPPEEQKKVFAAGGSSFEPMPGRGSKHYVVLPDAWTRDPAHLKRWLAKACACNATRPPKKTRPRRRKVRITPLRR